MFCSTEQFHIVFFLNRLSLFLSNNKKQVKFRYCFRTLQNAKIRILCWVQNVFLIHSKYIISGLYLSIHLCISQKLFLLLFHQIFPKMILHITKLHECLECVSCRPICCSFNSWLQKIWMLVLLTVTSDEEGISWYSLMNYHVLIKRGVISYFDLHLNRLHACHPPTTSVTPSCSPCLLSSFLHSISHPVTRGVS